MADPMLDTHRYYHTLKDGGFDERQAEALTTGLAQALSGTLAAKADLETAIAGLATKGDLKAEIAGLATKAELKAEIANLGTELRDEIHRLDLKIETTTQRLFFQFTGAVAVMLALFGFVGQHLK